jgi:hypothetical protein
MRPGERKTIAVAAVLVLCASVGLLAAIGDEPAPAPTVQSETLRLDLLNRSGHSGPERDAFMTRRPPRPAAPPVAPAPVEPPPPPAAPPLPFTFMGQFESPGEKTVYYLVEGDKLYAVTEGETINGTHRVESIQGNHMDIVYLPLSITQSLALGTGP